MAKSKRDSTVSNIAARVDKDSSVNVRQIENGFIVRESGTIGKGRNQKYYDKEWFSKTNPLGKITGMSRGGGSSSVSKMSFSGKKR